ncbi:MAG: hypothetical protein ABI861_06480 [Panacibacter sp.]
MKRTIKSALLIAASIFCMHVVYAQTFKDFFSQETNITYLGIDFTDVKVIGHTDVEVGDLVERQFSSINQLVLNEPKKFDLIKAFHKGSVESDISFVNAMNKKIRDTKISSVNTADEKRFTSATIDKMVKAYDFGNKKGIGVMFIMESLSKVSERASMYVTFIDMSNRKVLYTERMVEKVGGFGLRNYYAKSIYEVLDDIGKSKYKDWKKANE